VNNQNKRLLNSMIIVDDKNESKVYNCCTATNVNSGWVRRYKSINESQLLSDLLRDQAYRDQIILKKRSYQQLRTSPSVTSSLIKRRKDNC
jgi:hypothetical protein